ncbi:hypothetical protein CK203_116892 [Vitis vinifera]|uniref:Uncharacterized protein n=1 Tax=Vitis vinifera TaxID=29760 RepID=A0A438C969_VITVI|nr:hypothetical protein CK203_116892 [Vitis vinifera]
MSSNIIQPLQQPSGEESEKQSKAYWDDITMDAFIKENPEAIKFKTKGLKNVEQLDILFKDIVATGEKAWAPSQGFVGQDVDDSSKLTTQPSMEKKNEERRKRKRDETKSEPVAIQLERICSVVENRSSISCRGDKPGCSIVEVMKIIRGMPEVKNDFELYMKATNIMVVKENREMFVALEDPIDQIAWLKHKHV